MPKTALIILANGFEEIEAITPIDILRRAGISVTVAGLEKSCQGAHDITFMADCTLKQIKEDEFSAIILPGGLPGAKTLADSQLVKEIVIKHHKIGKIIAAICAAPGLALSNFGILDQRKATCYPGFEKDFPASATYLTDRVVVDGNLITSKGPGTAFPFALSLVSELKGQEQADQLADAMQFT